MRIALSGIDGSGKTTLLRRVQQDLIRRGLKARYTNLRGLHFRLLSLPFLLACRLLGKEGRWFEGGQIRRSRHPDLGPGHRFLKTLWALLFLCDVTILALLRGYFWRSKTVVLSDRNIVDVLVDLMVALDTSDMHRASLVQPFIKLLGADATLVLDIPEEVASQRKQGEVNADATLTHRRQLYGGMATRLGLLVVDASRPLDQVYKEVWACICDKLSESPQWPAPDSQ